MRKCMDAENLHRRMKKLMGQLQAIDQMIDKDVPCEDILIQINAVKGALHRVGQIVLEGHLQHCVRDGIEHGDADATSQPLPRPWNIFPVAASRACPVFFGPCLTTYTPIGILRPIEYFSTRLSPRTSAAEPSGTCRTCDAHDAPDRQGGSMLADVKEWLREEPRQALALGISAVALLLSFLELVPGPVDPAWLAVLLCGVPIIKEGAEGLFTRFDIKADVLVSLALLASVIIGEIFAAGEVAFIMQLGALLEERTVAKARAGIERLVHLTPRTARRLDGSAESIIPAAYSSSTRLPCHAVP